MARESLLTTDWHREVTGLEAAPLGDPAGVPTPRRAGPPPPLVPGRVRLGKFLRPSGVGAASCPPPRFSTLVHSSPARPDSSGRPRGGRRGKAAALTWDAPPARRWRRVWGQLQPQAGRGRRWEGLGAGRARGRGRAQPWPGVAELRRGRGERGLPLPGRGRAGRARSPLALALASARARLPCRRGWAGARITP